MPEHPEIIAGWERDAAAYRLARRDFSELGLRYGSHARQTIDVFHPDARDNDRPLVVFIHGGYWRSFDPSVFSHLAAGMNRRGHSVALPGYRLCPEVRIDDIIDDIRSALVHLYRRFPSTFVAAGHSAGGHLAAAAVATDWRAQGAAPGLLRRALTVSGLFDLAPLVTTSLNESLRLDPDSAKAASPAFWDPPADVVLEAWVGGAESSEYLRQSRLIADRWSAAGAKTRLHAIAGANHFTASAPLTDPESEMVATLIRLADTA